ncbi:hypothetical protein ABB37_09996 [Leptomonas pyrrhocoris]|uniref:CFA20 domain-containing protein n=1 Tax=Leptomonas pyrrhocoris TaxID=157538 RepID=A0A0N0DQH3_LEPPY|nr:hypothetical protein ABB37_09996 [Leptomonas pyrrhocoris]XP_015651732.1 hypothetical protein ABB37_09996 [Leptomonas pyrrhocoris]KPA73292.1 hypothetical protein ABB37_09996 [Leptomonas pyrrhocoris]KPA73293.1 hypothetical protein ABB37_09996 [Leptomonas pyrrhocoris]|eukprot:XP_015651731.1 hypothetical protein ABB37_09996 [Leptomonas pyrrhocoris]
MTSSLQLVMEASSKLLTTAKVSNPRGCSFNVDRHLQKPVLILKGAITETSVRLPREDRPLSSLQLHDSLLVAQICLDVLSHFALEIVVSHSSPRRTKLVIGTHLKTAKCDDIADEFTTAYLPLIIPRSKWVQVVFHVAGIVHSVFSLPSCKCIDAITVAGTGKVCCMYTSSDEQVCIDVTPENMALFAVPAYAPPIWKSAGPLAESPTSLPALEAANSAPAADSFVIAQSSTRSAPLSPSPSPARGRPSGHPSRLQPLASSPLPDSAPPLNTVSVRRESDRSSLKCDYIRLVEDDVGSAAEEGYSGRAFSGEMCPQSGGHESGNRRLLGNGARSAADSLGGGLSGWEQPVDDRKPEVAATSPGRLGKAEPPRRPQRKSISAPPSSAPADKERMQRIIASRKRQVSPRQNNTGASGPRARSTGSRRQQRLRRRMRVLRANEQKANRAAAAKTLAASDIPLFHQVELPEELLASTPPSFSETPLCGFGFGYLGVLKANGEYEEDEDANLNLQGALTLNSDDE